MNIFINEKGSLLIGLIMTITIMGLLSAGAIYLHTSSVQGSIFSNTYSRSYYLAESGVRYERLTGNTGTFVLSNGDKFIISKNSVTGIVQENNWAESKSVIAFTPTGGVVKPIVKPIVKVPEVDNAISLPSIIK